MSRISFTSRFFLKHKNSADHLYVRITVNRKSAEISLKRTINKSKWDDVKQRVKGSNETAQSLNHYISVNRSKLNSIHSELVRTEKDYSAKNIKDIFLGNDGKKHFRHGDMQKIAKRLGLCASAVHQYFNGTTNNTEILIESLKILREYEDSRSHARSIISKV